MKLPEMIQLFQDELQIAEKIRDTAKNDDVLHYQDGKAMALRFVLSYLENLAQ